MREEKVKRRLAAIVSADVVGWSRLMGLDEAGTLAALKAHREQLIDPQICDHGGRVVGTAGDSILAEFSSCIEAVQCAVGVQAELKRRNDEAPEERRMEFRVGINLGEVIIDGDDIFGDGVNIAARLQALAAPGDVFVSEDVYRQVHGRLDVIFEDLGPKQAKNIKEPVHVYRVSQGAPPGVGETASRAAAAATPAPQASNPAIAVLPFDNMSRDPDQEYFADGITEDIITELSRYPELFVIARNSTFVYRGTAVDIKQIARELGVSYVVEGSVRKAGNRVRITVQLIEAENGHHLWAERYDRDLDDVFALQDEITQMIVAALPRHLEAAQLESAKRKPPDNMAAYDYLLRAKDLHYRRSPEANEKALEMAEKAIALDPDFGQGYAWRTCIIGQSWVNGFGKSLDDLIEAGGVMSDAMDRLKADDIECHRILADINFYMYDDAERAQFHQDRAFALVPNDPRIVSQRGELLTYLGSPNEAAEWIEKAMRLDPSGADRRANHLGRALFVARRYEEAIAAFKRVSPMQGLHHIFLAACYAKLGQDAAAKTHAEEAFRLAPKLSLKRVMHSAPFAGEADRAHFTEALKAVGIPD